MQIVQLRHCLHWFATKCQPCHFSIDQLENQTLFSTDRQAVPCASSTRQSIGFLYRRRKQACKDASNSTARSRASPGKIDPLDFHLIWTNFMNEFCCTILFWRDQEFMNPLRKPCTASFERRGKRKRAHVYNHRNYWVWFAMQEKSFIHWLLKLTK